MLFDLVIVYLLATAPPQPLTLAYYRTYEECVQAAAAVNAQISVSLRTQQDVPKPLAICARR